jgi:hypothetical protein
MASGKNGQKNGPDVRAHFLKRTNQEINPPPAIVADNRCTITSFVVARHEADLSRAVVHYKRFISSFQRTRPQHFEYYLKFALSGVAD